MTNSNRRAIVILKRHWPALVALFALHIVIFARLIFLTTEGAPYAVVPFDFAQQYSPWLIYISDCFKSGHFPLWSPYVGGGTPFFINPQNQLYSPLTLLIASTIGYTHRITQLQTVFMLLFGGVGAYFLSYTLWRSRWAGFITAICFTYTSAVFGNLEHMTITNSVTLMIWLFLITTLTDEGARRWTYPALSFLIYFLITSGYPGVILMVLLWLLAYTLYLIYLRPDSLKVKLRRTLRYGLTWLLGLGMASAHWLPIVVYRKEFTRGASPLTLNESLSGGNLYFKHLWGMLFQFMTEYPLPGNDVDLSMRGVYFGALALPLILAALLLIKKRLVNVLLFFSVGTLLMSLGGMFFGRVGLHVMLPVLNMSRFPAADSRAMMVLGLTLLAGGGATLLQNDHQVGRRLIFRASSLLLASFFIALIGFRFAFDIETYKNVVINALTAEILFVGLALLALKMFSGRMLLFCIAALLALEVGTCVLTNSKVVGAPVSSADYQTMLAHHQRAFTPEGTNVARIAGGTDFVLEASGEAYTRKNFYLSEYNPLRLIRFQRLFVNGFTDWMTNGPRVVALPPQSGPQNHAAFETLAQPIEFQIQTFTPNEIIYQVNAAQDSLLVFNEMNFPGWGASTDGGARTPVSEISGGLRSLEVKAGAHRIVMTFEPRAFYWGITVSLISLVIFLVWIILLNRPLAKVNGQFTAETPRRRDS